jgi:hypothetical protein
MDILEPLAEQAIRLGADALEVEYKDRHEWVFAASGPLGFGIANFPSSSREAAGLREECYRLAKQKHPQHISVDGRDYELRCAIFDSFGEDAFRLTLRPVPRRVVRGTPPGITSAPPQPSAGSRRRGAG